MIDITLRLNNIGCLLYIDAKGHSDSAVRGEDLICGAVSTLLRTVSRTLENEPDVKLDGKIEERGDLQLGITLLEESKENWLCGVSAFLVTGLKDLASEHPHFCRIQLERKNYDVLE